jgi:E3 ubiquitin-protein ligase SHPRH
LPGVRTRIRELNVELASESKLENLENATTHLNLWKEMEHRLCFYIGGASHQLENEEDENEYYKLAEDIRKDLLQVAGKGVDRHSKITLDFYNKNTPMLQKEVLYPVELSGGLYSRDLFTYIEAIEDKLNDQIEVIFSWRNEIKRLLMEPLDDQDSNEGPTGDEFLTGIALQEKCASYQDELTTLIQYRRDTLLFDPKEYSNCHSCNIVIAQGHLADCSHQFCDKCKANFAPDLEGICPCPICFEEIVVADMVTQEFTSNFRKQPTNEIKNDFQRELRSEVADLALGETQNSYKTLTIKVKQISKNASLIPQERRLASMAYEHLSSHLETQTKHLKCLESELEHFNDLFNERVKYFRQLNKISDTVQQVQFDRPAVIVRKELKDSSDELCTKITALVGRKRYLAYLAVEGENESDSHRTCGICHNEVEKGVLTDCGHLAVEFF